MFGLGGLIGDVIKVATLPLAVAVPVVRVVTKPLGEVAHEVAKSVKEASK